VGEASHPGSKASLDPGCSRVFRNYFAGRGAECRLCNATLDGRACMLQCDVCAFVLCSACKVAEASQPAGTAGATEKLTLVEAPRSATDFPAGAAPTDSGEQLEAIAGPPNMERDGPRTPPRAAWGALENERLDDVFRRDVRTVQDVPRWFRGSVTRGFRVSLREWRFSLSASAWKLFLIVTLSRPVIVNSGALGRGSGQDRASMRCKHLSVLLDDEDTWDLFVPLAEAIPRADVPGEIAEALSFGRLTVVKVESGKVRGILAGAVMRQSTGRALAADFGEAILAARCPLKYALQSRAGTDAVGQALRLLTYAFLDLAVISFGGVGAFGHVPRGAMFRQLLAVLGLHSLLPYVRLWYGRQSRFLWTDDAGDVQEMNQGEGGEPGNPPMPSVLALAQHDSLAAARARLQGDDYFFAFFDYLYVVNTRGNAWAVCAAVTDKVATGVGVRINLGELLWWSKAVGSCPPDFEEIGQQVWAGGAVTHERGVKVLGTPLGQEDFVATHTSKRMAEEARFLEKVERQGDLKCARLLLAFLGVPHASHLLRVLPRSFVAPYARHHDEALWACFCMLLGCEHLKSDELARNVATPPARKGSFGRLKR